MAQGGDLVKSGVWERAIYRDFSQISCGFSPILGKTGKIRSAQSTLPFFLIVNSTTQELNPSFSRPSWIASLPAGDISHSTLDYPPLGCISHSSFVWPSLGGISNAGLVLPPWGALTGCQTGTVTSAWWICSGLTLWVWPSFLPQDSGGPKTAHLAVVGFRIISALIN